MSYRRGYDEGYWIGYCEGRAETVIRVLELRGVAMRTADRDFILGCTSLAALRTWLDRALEISAIRELFDA